MARPREHVIDTETRRIVPRLLPADDFVERDQTERDYGIDMILECFEKGEPSGAYLMLQLKGTDASAPPSGQRTIPFDIKVSSLKRVERFATPILLIWCPVQADPTKFWYLWTQNYIRVVLKKENPKWRNQQKVRLHIPTENVVSEAHSNEDKLRLFSPYC